MVLVELRAELFPPPSLVQPPACWPKGHHSLVTEASGVQLHPLDVTPTSCKCPQ